MAGFLGKNQRSSVTNGVGNSAEIIVRLIKPKLDDSVSKYWYGNNPYLTHFMNALSFIFPPGEETFVNSVNYFKEKITDPALRKDIKSFISQEFNHSHLHIALNQWVGHHNLKAIRYQEILTNVISKAYLMGKKVSPRFNLATTAAFEHLTAIMSLRLLSRQDIVGKMYGDTKNIFILHAIEEIEHKSVAYDVYQAIGGGYFLRIFSFLFATFFLTSVIVPTTLGLLVADRQFFNLKAGILALRELFGLHGYFTGIIKNYLLFFKPGFHPREIVDSDLLAFWKDQLAKNIEIKVNGRKNHKEPLGAMDQNGVGA